jgi:hypothetical protein
VRSEVTTMEAPKWQKPALYAVGAWTAFGGISALADPGGHWATFFGGPAPGPAIVAIAYAQLLAWGVGYALAAHEPAARGPMLAAGAVGKALYAAITIGAFASGAGTSALLATGIGDIAIAALFAWLVWGDRRTTAPSPRQAGLS